MRVKIKYGNDIINTPIRRTIKNIRKSIKFLREKFNSPVLIDFIGNPISFELRMTKCSDNIKAIFLTVSEPALKFRQDILLTVR
jgi:hypothetical protein